MASVVASLSMSLDGFSAHRDDSVGHLFDWYGSSPVEVVWPGNGMVSRVTPGSAAVLRETIAGAGALVVGRRLFDYTQGWAGRHPLGVPVFVVTHREPGDWSHPDAPFTFVLDGVAPAVAQAVTAAGDGTVGVAGPNIVRQCLDQGLLDELAVDLVPVLLGDGIRFFDHTADAPVLFENPTVVEGDRVTHLRYARARSR